MDRPGRPGRELRAQGQEEGPKIAARKLRLDPQAADFLRRLPPEPKRRIRAGLDAIGQGGDVRELGRSLSGWSRLRVGRFRVIYRVQTEVRVLAIGPREIIYEEAARLLKAVEERRGTYLRRRRAR